MIETEPSTVPERETASSCTASRPIAAPLVAFFVLAYAISWAWVIPWAATGQTVGQGDAWPTHLPSLLGPMLAAFAVSWKYAGRDGPRSLLRRMFRWRIGWRWWIAALSPLGFFVVLLAGMAAVGAKLPAPGALAEFSGISKALGVVGVALTIIVVNGFGEETGWRGYALPTLERRFMPLTASLIIAILWAGWHVPPFVLLDSYRGVSVAMVPIFFFGLLCGSVVLTWMYNRTGSVLAVAVWHGLYNVTGATAAATNGTGAIAAAVWTFVVVFALALLAADWRNHRAGRPSLLTAPEQQASHVDAATEAGTVDAR